MTAEPARGTISRPVLRTDLGDVFRRDYEVVVGVATRVLGSRDQAEDVADTTVSNEERTRCGWRSPAAPEAGRRAGAPAQRVELRRGRRRPRPRPGQRRHHRPPRVPQRRAVDRRLLAWAALWVAMLWGLAALSFLRKDL